MCAGLLNVEREFKGMSVSPTCALDVPRTRFCEQIRCSAPARDMGFLSGLQCSSPNILSGSEEASGSTLRSRRVCSDAHGPELNYIAAGDTDLGVHADGLSAKAEQQRTIECCDGIDVRQA